MSVRGLTGIRRLREELGETKVMPIRSRTRTRPLIYKWDVLQDDTKVMFVLRMHGEGYAAFGRKSEERKKAMDNHTMHE